MSLPDSPDLAEQWCPACQPERDPTREILRVHWCHQHEPSLDGAQDAAARDCGPLYSAEINPEANRAVCQAIHGGRR